MVMIILGVVGIALFLAARLIARIVVGGNGDPTGLTRVIQGVAVILVVVALVFRPYQEETAAFPPPPDAPSGR